MKWSGHMLLLAASILALSATASADIFQWTDEAGVIHYTNLRAEVPTEAQASIHVVVDEAARRQPTVNDAPAPVPDPPAPVPHAEPSQAQLVDALYERSLWLSAYLAGLQSGLDRGGAVASGGSVEINGPLVVGGSNPWPAAYNYGWPYAYGCAWPYDYGCSFPYFYPGVAVFHREHLRHFGPFHGRPFAFGGRMRSVGHFRARR